MESSIEASQTEGGPKPKPAPKPRLTPKPFSLQQNTTIRSIYAPKTITSLSKATKHQTDESEAPGVPKATLTTPAQEQPQQPATSDSKLDSVSVQTKDQPITTEEKKTCPHGEDTLGSSVTPRKTDPASESAPPEKTSESEPIQKEDIIQRNHKTSTDVVTNSEEKDKKKKEDENQIPVVQKLEESGGDDSSTANPKKVRGSGRNRLSMELTSKFESGGLSLPPQPIITVSPTTSKDNAKQPVPPNPEQSPTTLELPNSGGSSIKRRISLLLDSSSRPEVVVKREEPEIVNGAGAVKERIKNWRVETGSDGLKNEKKPQVVPRIRPKSFDPTAFSALEKTPPKRPPVELPGTVTSSTEATDPPSKISPAEQPAETLLDKSKDDPPEAKSSETSTGTSGEPEQSKSTEGDDQPRARSPPATHTVTDEGSSAASESVLHAPKGNIIRRRSVHFGVVERDDGEPPVVLCPETESNAEDKAPEDGNDLPFYRRVAIFQNKDKEVQKQEEERLKHLEFEKKRKAEESLKEKERLMLEEERKQKEEEEEKARQMREEEKKREEEKERERLKEEERERERLREEEREKERQMELMWQRQREEERERAKQKEEILKQEQEERLKEEERKEERLKEERERQRLREELKKTEDEEKKREEELELMRQRQKEEDEEKARQKEERLRQEEKEKERLREEERKKEEELELMRQRQKEEDEEKARQKEERLRQEEKEKERLKEEARKKEEELELMRQRQKEEDEEKARQKEERLRQEEKEKEEERKKEEELELMRQRQKEEDEEKARQKEERLRQEEKEKEEERKKEEELELMRQRQKEEDEEKARQKEERLRQEEREKERLREEERKKEEERMRERQREIEEEERRKKEQEKEEMEKMRQIEMERQREEERKRQIEKERAEELERKRQEELERKQAEEVEEKLRMEREREELKQTNFQKEEDEEREMSVDGPEIPLISFDSEPQTPSGQTYQPIENPLEDVYDDFSVRKPQFEVDFEDFSVKPNRWGSQAKVDTSPVQTTSMDENVGMLVDLEDETQERNVPEQAEKPDSPKPTPARENPEEEEKEDEVDAKEEDDKQETQLNSYRTGGEDKDTDALIDGEPDLQNGACEPTSESDSSKPAADQPPEVSSEDVDLNDFQREPELSPFPESTTPLLDTSAQKSKADLGKRRLRTHPSRSLLVGLTETDSQDWKFCDSTDGKEKPFNRRESESEEEQPKPKIVCSPPPTSQRVPIFPGLNPAALIAQLKKRTGGGGEETEDKGRQEKEIPNAEVSPSPTQMPRSPRSAAHLAGAALVLPPLGGKDGGATSSPAWLKELKSKKRLSQHEADA